MLAGAVLAGGVTIWAWLRHPELGENETNPRSADAAAMPKSEARQLVTKAWETLDSVPEPARAELDAATEYYQRAVALDPTDADVWALGSQIDTWYVAENIDSSAERRESARTKATKALNLSPHSYEARLAQAVYLVRGEGFDTPSSFAAEAEKQLRELLREKPDEPHALLALGHLLRNSHRVDDASLVFDRLAKNPSWTATATNAKAWMMFRIGRRDEAVEIVARSVKARPFSGNVRLQGYLAMGWLGDLELAKAALDQMPAGDFREDSGTYFAVNVYWYRREAEQMLRVLNTAPREWVSSFSFTGPKDYWVGVAQQMAGNQEAAAVAWQAGLRLVEQKLAANPSSAELQALKGQLLVRLGERAAAEKAFKLAEHLGWQGWAEFELGDAKAVLAKPDRGYGFSWATLCFSPAMDFLRGDPRFEAGLAAVEKDPKRAPRVKRVGSRENSAVVKVDEKSIAVLPFENRSDSKEDLFFTDGIHDDLLTQISRIRTIKTISRTSVMTYRGSTKKLREIAGELGVATIMEGGVQRAGNQVRINVQLIDAATDTHLWAETYTRELTAGNIFAIQSEIAGAIATALKGVMSPEEQKQMANLPTQNLAALEAFFRAKESREKETVSGNEAAIAELERAIALDPKFVLAQAMLGQTLLEQRWIAGLPAARQIAQAEPHILRAVSLDEKSSEAAAALGDLRQQQGRGDEAKAAYERAIAANPNNAGAYRGYINFLEYGVGDAAAIARVLERYLELDPNSETGQSLQAARLIATGRLQEALQLRESIAARHPASALIQYSLGTLYRSYFGRYDDAIIALRKAYSLDPRNPVIAYELAFDHADLGDPEGTAFWRERYFAIHPGSERNDGWSAILSDTLGDKAEAERLALRAVEKNPESVFGLWVLLNADIISGHPEKSRQRYAAAGPEFFQADVKINPWNVWAAKDVARVLYATGERAQADKLIDGVLSLTRSMPSNWDARVIAMIAHAVAGHEAEALQAARRFIDAGGSPAELVKREAELSSLRKFPEFREMIEQEKNRIPAQLARLKRLEAAGELAPIPTLSDRKT